MKHAENKKNRTFRVFLTAVIAMLFCFAAGCTRLPDLGVTEEQAVQTDKDDESATSTPSAPEELKGQATTSDEEEEPEEQANGKLSDILISRSSKTFLQKLEVSTKLPAVCIYTRNKENITSVTDYLDCAVYTVNDESGYAHEGTAAGIRVRGNSSAYYGDVEQILKNQVPYRIKFNSKDSFFGLNDGLKRKSWVLLKGNWNLLMDDVGFSLGRLLLHENNYCSDSQMVRVYVNNKDMGIYCLCEQSQTGKGRVDINEPAEGYTGTDIGYFFEIDNYCEEPRFNVDYAGATVTDIKGEARKFTSADYSVKSEIYSDEQLKFIKKYVNNLFNMLYSAFELGEYYTFNGDYDLVEAPEELQSGEALAKRFMDIDSVVDTYILHEIVTSCDIGEGSFFMCVDFSARTENGRLKFTSPWDFNWGYDTTVGYYAGAFCSKDFMKSFGDRSHPWFIIFAKQEWFMDLVKNRLSEIGASGFEELLREEREFLETYGNDLVTSEEDWSVGAAEQLLDKVEKRIDWIMYKYLVL